MRVYSLLFLVSVIALASISHVRAKPKPFYWEQNPFESTKKPFMKRAFSLLNHWFKNLVDAYPSSTWSWREHLYGRTYWDDPELKKRWYYKGYEDDKLKKQRVRRPMFNQYEVEGYYMTTKPGCQGDDWSILDKSMSEWGKRIP